MCNLVLFLGILDPVSTFLVTAPFISAGNPVFDRRGHGCPRGLVSCPEDEYTLPDLTFNGLEVMG